MYLYHLFKPENTSVIDQLTCFLTAIGQAIIAAFRLYANTGCLPCELCSDFNICGMFISLRRVSLKKKNKQICNIYIQT